MYNRWIHICQAIDFKTSKITTVVNGFVSDDSTFQYMPFNESNPIGRIETMKDNFVIGLLGDSLGWTNPWYGKYIFN